MSDKNICDECYDCRWYWQNNDTEMECQGEEKICCEFIKEELKEQK